MHYEILGGPVFRERDVPRMTALADRADGSGGEAPDLRGYEARSAAAKRARLAQDAATDRLSR